MPSDTLKNLRDKAEELLSKKNIPLKNDTPFELSRIIHELQIYQVELEMQNDELALASREIEKQKNRFLSLFDVAPVGYVVISPDGVIIDINKTGLRLFGRDKVMLTGKPFAAFVASASISDFYTFLRNVSKSRAEATCQLQLSSYQNSGFSGLLNRVAVNDAAGESLIYVTLTDITEKQKNENALQNAKQRLELALEASKTGICELNPDTGRFFLDGKACELLGFDKDEFAGPLEQLVFNIHPHDLQNLEQGFRTAVIKSQALNQEFRVINDSGGIEYRQLRGRLVDDGKDKRKFLSTFTDITEAKILEKEARRLKEEQDNLLLEASLDAEEKEKKRMSEALHDGVAQMLYATKLTLNNLKKEAPNLSFDSVTTLIDQTIRDVRNLSFELTPTVLSGFGLKATIEEMTHRLASTGVKFESSVEITGNLPLNTQLSIYRIVQELVNNSIKHAKCDLIQIKVNNKSGAVLIQVSDNGIGMDKDKDMKKLSGSGLAGFLNRLKLYNGKLDIKQNRPAGTRITVTMKNIKEAESD